MEDQGCFFCLFVFPSDFAFACAILTPAHITEGVLCARHCATKHFMRIVSFCSYNNPKRLGTLLFLFYNQEIEA